MSRLLSHRMDIRSALTTAPKPVCEVLPGLHLGSVGSLVAPGSTGKTMLLLQLAIAIATGEPALGGLLGVKASQSKPGRVVMVVAEETADEMQRRLHHVVMLMLNDVQCLFTQKERDEFLTRLHDNFALYPLSGRMRLLVETRDGPSAQLVELEEACLGARLVIVDPLRQFHTGDENDSWAMTAVLQAFQRIAGSQGCAALLAHHTNKTSTLNGQGDLASASRGSGALTDGVRWQLNLSRLDEKLASTYGIGSPDLGWYIRADLAKSNYLPPQAPQVFRRSVAHGGALVLMKNPDAAVTRKLVRGVRT